MDFELPEEVLLVKQTVKDFIDREVIPLERGFRPEGEEMPPELLEPLQAKAKALGFWHLDVPQEYGGAGLDLLTRCAIAEEVARTAALPFRGNWDATAAPHGCYRCQGEDRWCVLSVKTEDQWQKFCQILGRPDMVTDSRFSNHNTRCNYTEELDEIVESWTHLRPPEEVMDRLQAVGIAAGVVQNGADLVRDPQLRHRNYFESFTRSPIGAFEVPRSALNFQGMSDDPLSLPSPLGSDTESILHDLLGYDGTTISQWREEGVLS